jgi:thioredoxin reductase
MRTTLCLAAIVLGLAALVVGFTQSPRDAWAQDAPKNLKVFPPNTSKADLKKAMKSIAASLGVQCDFCHDLEDMSKDTEHKLIAREMMKTADINTRHFKGKQVVGCITCHNGQKEPKHL